MSITPSTPGVTKELAVGEQAPKTLRRALLVLLSLVALSVWVLPLDLASVTSWHEFQAACTRLWDFASAFGSPDLSQSMLSRCASLAMETVAVALLGVAIGLTLAYPLAVAACRAVVIAAGPTPLVRRWLARAVLEIARFVLDVMRGVPDFVWAVLLANITGVNPVTGLLAIAISVAGIFGKVLSEQWDNVDGTRYVALRSTGASRLQVFFYGLQPLGARTTLSFVLMRTECAIRNASVIGVVGGGGLGAGLWDEYTDANWRGVATILLTLLVVTASADLLANFVRRRLRIDANHPRAPRAVCKHLAARRRLQVIAGVGVVLLGCVWWLWVPLQNTWHELGRIDWPYVEQYTFGLFRPSWSMDTWWAVLRESVVPLAIGVLATLGGGLLAVMLVYPASLAMQLDSARFTGERVKPVARVVRVVSLVLSRAIALVMRGIPEVAWLVMLAVFFRSGVTPCVLAVALHTAGVLHRVFTEAVDDVPYGQLERVRGPRSMVFWYGALPRIWANWRTYGFFQFEVNMRIGIALGMVGAGGLGLFFKNNLAYREHADAAAFLWGMILLTVLVDRLSRWLQLTRNRC
ncbi:MAG: phosphonate transport system permease protein [Planctomycetota bacterium]